MTLRISIAYLGANGCHQNMENVTVKDRRLHWCVIGMQKKQSFWTVRLGLFYFTVGADKVLPV